MVARIAILGFLLAAIMSPLAFGQTRVVDPDAARVVETEESTSSVTTRTPHMRVTETVTEEVTYRYIRADKANVKVMNVGVLNVRELRIGGKAVHPGQYRPQAHAATWQPRHQARRPVVRVAEKPPRANGVVKDRHKIPACPNKAAGKKQVPPVVTQVPANTDTQKRGPGPDVDDYTKGYALALLITLIVAVASQYGVRRLTKRVDRLEKEVIKSD